MREIISLSVGQCGNQIANQFWSVICQEHSIDTASGQHKLNTLSDIQLERAQVYFQESELIHSSSSSSGRLSASKYVPRAILIDLEPGVLEGIKGENDVGRVFHPDNFVYGANGAGNNWAKGHYTEGAELLEEIMDVIRKEAERCESFQGFQITHSLGGGTGSGLGTLLLSCLHEEFPDRMKSTFSVFPSGSSDCVVEPYNTTLAVHQLIENADAVFCIDNAALYEICYRKLKLSQPTYSDLNKLISTVMSGVTSCLRFPGQLNSDLRKMSVNLVPFPRQHFFVSSVAPLMSQEARKCARNDKVRDIISNLFDDKSMMAKVDTRQGRYLTAAVMIRGKTGMRSIEGSIQEMKQKHSPYFVEWIPNAVQLSQCSIPFPGETLSGTFIGNSTSVADLFRRVGGQFGAMFRRKAFFHWYVEEGMEEMEFTEAESNMNDLIQGYEWAMSVNDEDSSLEEDNTTRTKDISDNNSEWELVNSFGYDGQ